MSEGAEVVAGREGTYLRAHLGVRMEPVAEDAIRGVVPVTARSRTADGRRVVGGVERVHRQVRGVVRRSRRDWNACS